MAGVGSRVLGAHTFRKDTEERIDMSFRRQWWSVQLTLLHPNGMVGKRVRLVKARNRESAIIKATRQHDQKYHSEVLTARARRSYD